jgi:hypothetical protein
MCGSMQVTYSKENLPRVQSRFKNLGVNPWMAVSFALGMAQAWRNRFFMTFDGISYLDMGDAYLRGD